MLGKLNVVTPSPGPNVTPTAENKLAYVVRLTAAPLQSSVPSGAEAPPYIVIVPGLV